MNNEWVCRPVRFSISCCISSFHEYVWRIHSVNLSNQTRYVIGARPRIFSSRRCDAHHPNGIPDFLLFAEPLPPSAPRALPFLAFRILGRCGDAACIVSAQAQEGAGRLGGTRVAAGVSACVLLLFCGKLRKTLPHADGVRNLSGSCVEFSVCLYRRRFQ